MHSCTTLSSGQQLLAARVCGQSMLRRAVGVKGEVARQRCSDAGHTACSRDCSQGPLPLPPSPSAIQDAARRRARVKKSERASSGPLLATFSLGVGGGSFSRRRGKRRKGGQECTTINSLISVVLCEFQVGQGLARAAIGRQRHLHTFAPVRILESDTVSARVLPPMAAYQRHMLADGNASDARCWMRAAAGCAGVIVRPALIGPRS